MSSPAIGRLWAGLRLVVIDVETAEGPEGHRIISFAAVTCRNDTVGGRWQEFINPGIRIDAATMAVHGLTDERIAHEFDFATYAPRILETLGARPGETVVLAAHNVRFDVPLLREELNRAGFVLPDLPLLDTMRGLTAIAGVRPKGNSLDALLTKLGLTNFARHDALGDAVATAEAARLLLRRVAESGIDDLGRLLAAAADGTAQSVIFSGPRHRPKSTSLAAPARPDSHLASHGLILPVTAAPTRIAAWAKSLDECAALRCDLLIDRVAAAQPPIALVFPAVLGVIRARAALNDVAGTATVLAPSLPLLERLPAGLVKRELRASAEAIDVELSRLFDPLGRCGDLDRCPNCRFGEPCALDVWRLALGPAAIGGPLEVRARQFIMPTPGGRVQPYFSLRARGHESLADAALRLIVRHYRATGFPDRADQLVDLAWANGCRDPEIAEAQAVNLAAAGRDPDLHAAAAVCAETLPRRNGSTDEAWRLLAIREASIEGQLERRRVRYGDQVDENGQPIPLRRHHPTNPRRVRAARFLRADTGTRTNG